MMYVIKEHFLPQKEFVLEKVFWTTDPSQAKALRLPLVEMGKIATT